MSKDILFKVLGLVLIFLGEFAAIYGELLGSKFGINNPHMLLKPIVIAMIGGILLVVGYVISYTYFKNIWVVAAFSIAAIFIIEPILARSMFQEMPTRGAIIGFGFAVLAALSSIFL